MNLKMGNLSVNFGLIEALAHLNLDIKSDHIAILGQNGSGKTTLVAVLCGLLSPTSGTASINGIEAYRQRNHASRVISGMFDRVNFPYRMKVSEFVNFLSKERGCNRDIVEFISSIDASHILEKRMSELSSGEEQLISVINTILCNDGILILDEPFSRLDLFRESILLNFLSDRRETQYIFSTHIPEEAEAIGDFFVILNRGTIAWSGTIDELYKSDLYEVYTMRHYDDFGFKSIFDFGNTHLVRTDESNLEQSRKEGKILGYRKSGVRRVYYEIK